MSPTGPGLFDLPPATAGGDDQESIEDAIRVAFEDLDEKGLLGPVERAKRAALIKGGAALDRGMASAKVSVATSTILKQVLEGLDTLPQPAAGQDAELDAFDRALIALTDEALGIQETA